MKARLAGAGRAAKLEQRSQRREDAFPLGGVGGVGDHDGGHPIDENRLDRCQGALFLALEVQREVLQRAAGPPGDVFHRGFRVADLDAALGHRLDECLAAAPAPRLGPAHRDPTRFRAWRATRSASRWPRNGTTAE
jgi:hypothetical protein